MSTVQSLAREALARHSARTQHYRWSINGLTADERIAEYVKKVIATSPQFVDDEAYFALIRSGEPKFAAATAIGVDPVAIARRLKIDQDFAIRMKIAQAQSMEPVERELRKVALDDTASFSDKKWAMLKLLEVKDADQWGEQERKIKVDHSHTVRVTGDPIDDEILQLEADLQEQAQVKSLNPGVIDIPDEDIQEL